MEIKKVKVTLLTGEVFDYHVDGKVFSSLKEAEEYVSSNDKKDELPFEDKKMIFTGVGTLECNDVLVNTTDSTK